MPKKGGLGKGLGGDAPKSPKDLRAQIKAEQDALLAAHKANAPKPAKGAKPKGGLGKGFPTPKPRKPPPPPPRSIDDYRRKRQFRVTSNVQLAHGWTATTFVNPTEDQIKQFVKSLPPGTRTFADATGTMVTPSGKHQGGSKTENLFGNTWSRDLDTADLSRRWQDWHTITKVTVHTKAPGATPKRQAYRADLPF